MQRMRFAWICGRRSGARGGGRRRGDGRQHELEGRDAEPRRVLDAAARPTKLIEEFRKTPQGSGVNIRASYGPSSAQGQAVANGLPADGVILNTGTTSTTSSTRASINRNWDKQSYNGVVWNSVVVFGLRNGNPKKIKGWNDLLKPGVEVVTVNPFTGGIAKWNILAALRRAAPAGEDRQAGDRLPRGSSTRTTSSPRTRRDRTRRTRSSRARATSCSRSRARRSTGRSRTSSRARRC